MNLAIDCLGSHQPSLIGKVESKYKNPVFVDGEGGDCSAAASLVGVSSKGDSDGSLDKDEVEVEVDEELNRR